MLKKYKNVIVIFILFNVFFGIFISHNSNNLDETIFLEFSQNYMNADISNKIIEDDNSDIEYIELYKDNNVYNNKFNVTNMFPGDYETKYYCVNVSYKDIITLKYSVDIKSDYKEIEDVFNLKIRLINDDEILYSGAIKNITENVDYTVSSNESVSEDFCYEITAYLDTSVGNEYQNKEVIIDFKWEIENENLEYETNPDTGDNIVFWFGFAIVSVIGLLILLLVLRKERKIIK